MRILRRIRRLRRRRTAALDLTIREGGHPLSQPVPRNEDTGSRMLPMNAQRFNDITIGTPVIVYSFGIHYGRIAGKRRPSPFRGARSPPTTGSRSPSPLPMAQRVSGTAPTQTSKSTPAPQTADATMPSLALLIMSAESRRHSSAPAATASCRASAMPASLTAGRPAATPTGRRSSAES
jgi:hypothetical protein